MAGSDVRGLNTRHDEKAVGWRPLGNDHAIETVQWRVRLRRPLTQAHQKRILAGDERMRAVLPRAESPSRMFEFGRDGVRMVEAGSAAASDAPAMLNYKRYAADGSVGLSLSIEADSITIVNGQYSRWKRASSMAQQLFADVGSALRNKSDDAEIVEMGLDVKDVFWWSGELGSAELDKLLQVNDQGWLTPKWAFSCGTGWHSDQGKWCEPQDYPGEIMVERMLLQGCIGNVGGDKNLKQMVVANTTMAWRRHPTQCEHPLPLRLQDAFSSVVLIDKQVKNAQDRFNGMHRRGNDLLRSVLTNTMRQRIGLKDA